MNKDRTRFALITATTGRAPLPDAGRMVFKVCGRPGQNDRPALPPGHPTTWRLLTDGTTLHGAAYPFPVFEGP